MTLTLASRGHGRDEAVTVSYAQAVGSNPIKDLSGKESDSFDRQDRGIRLGRQANLTGHARKPAGEARPGTTPATARSSATSLPVQEHLGQRLEPRLDPNMPGSNTNTTSYTASRSLTNGIEYTFEVRPVIREGTSGYVAGREADIKSAFPGVPLTRRQAT